MGTTATLGIAAYALRRLLTPERDRPDNVDVLEVGTDTVVLGATVDTTTPGRYGLWLDRGTGHARLGEIISRDEEAGTVTRVLDGVDRGKFRPGPARWNGYYYGGDPSSSLGLPFEHVRIAGPVGNLPAWVVPAPSPQPGAGDAEHPGGDGEKRWAVLVHGRGALRSECLRAIPVLHRLGWTCLVAAYRNDEDGPSSGDNRYALGLSEWADVDAALEWATSRGAERIALVGWSMGGAIALQTLDRSHYAHLVSHVILDGPVVDWGVVIRHHIRLGGLPDLIAHVAPYVLRSSGARHLLGIESPLDVSQTDWTGRAQELRHQTLLIHSVDDTFVPADASIALAQARPDMVRYVRWSTARHTKEWNTDPERWEAEVARFLRS